MTRIFRFIPLVVGILIVAGFVLYMFSFTVGFTQSAVKTTLGSAGDSSVITEPGWKFKWPVPVQSVTRYDNRLRVLQATLEQQQTADNQQIAVQAFLTWRVADPLTFYRRFQGQSGGGEREHYAKAEETLRTLLRSALSEVSGYRLTDMFTSEGGGSKLSELESRIMARLQQPAESADAAGATAVSYYGIEVSMVGISNVVLPEQTTRAVFDAMKAQREAIASEARSQGDSLATQIVSQAENEAQQILSFTETQAIAIRNKGDLEAAPYIAKLNVNPQLAVFLRALEFMNSGLGRKPTLIFSTDDLVFKIFSPEVLEQLQAGMIPDLLESATSGGAGEAGAGGGRTPARGEGVER